MSTYSEKLRDPRWQKLRLEVLQRDKWTCQICGDIATELQVHHKRYERFINAWEYKTHSLITLCKHCHFVVEDIKVDLDIIPVSVFKKKIAEDTFIVFALNHEGLIIYRGKSQLERVLSITHATLKSFHHLTINHWLLNEL